MRSSLLLGLTVVVLLGITVPPCKAGFAITQLMPKIVNAILFTIGQFGTSFSFLGHSCQVETEKQPDGFFTTQMTCTPWITEIGEGRNLDDLEALRTSIQTFIVNAYDDKLFTIEEIEEWLAS
ncbi:hypothetical protein O3P69_004703 [Scylla paramamosain]|uniref:Anti-lipopolysaccharide factor n=1 Tax=Scylla paramamosain TaxID=85552 RepID=A0AAW0UAN9_SCYPA|nr:scygonadin isoform 4 [Scylla paramamosain]UDM59921.1 scygonadin isoform 4 [Scylla paramamosain]